MKKRLQGLVAGILIGALSTGGVAIAKTGTEIIEAVYQDLKIYIDGVKIDPKTANGNSVEPFIYQGTTYLPVRAIGEAFGKPVSYDGVTKSVYIGTQPGENQYLLDVCTPFLYKNFHERMNGEKFEMEGKEYTNGFYLGGGPGSCYAIFNLDGQYESLSFRTGYAGGNKDDVVVSIYVDDELVEEFDVLYDALAKEYTIPLNYGLKLEICTDDDYTKTGFANVIIK